MRLLTWELERMTLDAEQTHSQNSQVIDEFRRNGGQVGGNFEGAPVLLLHTVGAKSGAERINPMSTTSWRCVRHVCVRRRR